MDIDANGTILQGLVGINVILGRNGAGKSRLLRHVENFCRTQSTQYGAVKYITPERGGEWKLDPSIEINLRNSANWAHGMRNKNRYEQYREMAMSEFAALELGFFRRAEADQYAGQTPNVRFATVLDKINLLLDYVKITRPDQGRGSDQPYPIVPKNGADYGQNFMSSGEAELVALGCEIVSFSHRTGSATGSGKANILFIDEPDVHLHPDLQYRLMSLLLEEVRASGFAVLLATHSTTIVAALSENSDARVAFMTNGASTLSFQPISSVIKDVLPIFGAHPLSNVFNESPLLLVEGEDDERIWQQAIRSSQNKLKLWPCAAGGVGNFPSYEQTIETVARAVYDRPRAFSLRDKDNAESHDLVDTSVIVRMRLNCRSAENLLLSDDVLRQNGTDWASIKRKIDDWMGAPTNVRHPQAEAIRAFKDSNFDRQNFDLKEIRNVLLTFIGTSKPWEVVVGQAIAKLAAERADSGANSLAEYLGEKVVRTLGLSPS